MAGFLAPQDEIVQPAEATPAAPPAGGFIAPAHEIIEPAAPPASMAERAGRYVADTFPTAGRILLGMKTGFGDEPVGMSPKTEQQMQDAGIFRSPEHGGIIRAANEVVLRPAAVVGDALMRGINALNFGAAEGAGQVAEGLGQSETDANRLRRDVNIGMQVAPFAGMGVPPAVKLPLEPVPKARPVAPEAAPPAEPAPLQIQVMPRLQEGAVPSETPIVQAQRRTANQDRMTEQRNAGQPPVEGEAPPASEAPGQPLQQRPGNAPFADTADVARDRRVAEAAPLVREHFGVPEEQFAQLPVDARERLTAAAQQKATAERPNAEPLRTSDAARGEGPYDPATKPNESRGADAQTTGEAFAGERATDRVAQGASDRPFRAESTDGATPDQARGFEERAYARQEQARAETVDDLQRGWQRRRNERDTAAEDAYRDSAAKDFSNRPGAPDEAGRYATDDYGLVKSDKGGPVRFGDQKQAARWIINEGHKQSPDQIFEIVNHPKGGFSVRESGRSAPKETPGGSGPGNYPAPARAAAEPPRQAARQEPVAHEGGVIQPDPRSVADVTRNLDQRSPRERNIIGKDGQPRTVVDNPIVKRGDTPYRDVPQRPASIIDAVKEIGISQRDLTGELAQIFDGRKNAAREVIRKDGQQLDYVREAMIERGYLPEGASLRDFYDALDRDQRARAGKNEGGRVFSEADLDHVNDWRAANEYNDQLHEIARNFGIDEVGLTAEKFWRIAEERLSFEEQARMSHDFAEARAADFDKAMSLEQMEAARAEGPPAGDYALKPRGEPEPAGRARAEGDVADGGKPADARGREGDVPARDRGQRDPAADEPAGRPEDGAGGDAARGRGDAEPRLDVGGETKAKPLTSTRETLEAQQRGRQGSDKQQERPEGGLFGEVRRLFQDDSGSVPADIIESYVEAFKKASAAFRDSRASSAGQTAVDNLGRMVAYSSNGWIRSIEKGFKSPTLDGVIKQFEARAGKGEGVKETIPAAEARETNMRLSTLQKALGDLKDNLMPQVAAQVRSDAARAGTPIGDAAIALTKFLKEHHAYLKGAGLDIGNIARGYFPLIVEDLKVLKDPAGFKATATRAFRIDGATPAEAAKKAEFWTNSILLGEKARADMPFARPGSTGAAAFEKGRELSKRAEAILEPYLVNDPRMALSRYVTSSVRRAEVARRFGDDWSKWGDIERKIAAEGAEGALPALRTYIQTMTGTAPRGAFGSKSLAALSWTRTIGSLGTLAHAAYSSIVEPVLPAVRTGRITDAFASYGNSVKELARDLAGMKASKARAFAEDIGIIAEHLNDTLLASRWNGGEPTSMAQARVLHQFFRRTLLDQWTQATQVASSGIGRVFVRRLAHEMEGGGTAVTKRYIQELGVPAAQVDAFAKWVRSHPDAMPDAAALTGEMGTMYRTAIGRFTDQTIMRVNPGHKPVWANHPLGSVVFQLRSYQAAFTRDVLGRLALNTRDAMTPGNGFTAWDRARLLAPLGVMPLFILANIAATVGRDELGDAVAAAFGVHTDPKEETATQTVVKHASRANLLGALDPLANMVQGKYASNVTKTLAGPAIGNLASTADAFIDELKDKTDGKDHTGNGKDRAFAKAIYSSVLVPLANLGLTWTPVGAASGLVTQVLQSKAGREGFANATAGVKPPTGGRAGRHGRGERTSGRAAR